MIKEPVKFKPIRKGLLEFLTLKIVANGPVYAGDILKRLAFTEFATRQGTLYPLLGKLQREGLLLYEWRESANGPPRKYYELTPEGRTQLGQLNDYWLEINRTIAQLEPQPDGKESERKPSIAGRLSSLLRQ